MTRSDIADVLAAIERRDAEVGAFTDVLATRATCEAEIAERELTAGASRGALHGMPCAVKQLFDVAGADRSYGSDVFDARRATDDAQVVQRLRRAGAVIVGTTRSHEFGWGITTQHARRGSTRNPHDPSRVPGGSSGGSAAAVAAGLVPLAVGSDTGGSIRIPAAFCGVLGLKTTLGRISRAGGVALAPSFDSPGFLARRVDVLAAALDATAGADPDDPATIGAPPVGAYAPVSAVATMRFAVADNLASFPLPASRRRSLDVVADGLRSLGAQQVTVEVPDGAEWLHVFVPLQMAEARHVHTHVLGTFPQRAEAYGADVRGRLELAAEVTVGDYLDARRAADALTARMVRALEAVDLLVSPVGCTGPSTSGDPDHVRVGGAPVTLRDATMPTTVPQNVAGLPSITVPVGLDEDDLPIGVQLTGRRWSESTLLSVGRALELAGLVTVAIPEGA